MINFYSFLKTTLLFAICAFALPAVSQQVIVDPTLNSSDASNGADDRVLTIATPGDGKILIGGKFTNYNGEAKANFLQLNSDGTIDENFNVGGAGANGEVRSIVVDADGKILIAGNFTTYNGIAVGRIARLNINGSLDGTFNTGGAGANGYVWDLGFDSNGKIVIGGALSSYNGNAVKYICRLNGDGTYDGSFTQQGTGANNFILHLTIDQDDKILIGGSFATFDGASTNRLARLNTDGTLDVTFNNGGAGLNPTASVGTIVIDANEKIMVGGMFTTYNGTSVDGLIRLNPNGSLDDTFGQSSSFGTYAIIIDSNEKILVGGYANASLSPGLKRLNSDGTIDTHFKVGTGANDYIWTARLADPNHLLIGGDFTSFNGVARNRIARVKILDTQTINNFGDVAKTYGDVPFNLSATATSGLSVSYSSSNTNVATVSGNTVTIVGAGTTDITASQAGNSDYFIAASVQKTLTVSKAVLTATAENKTRIYGTSSPTFTIVYSGLVDNDTPSAIDTPPSTNSTGLSSSSSVGTYPITLADGADNNYTFGPFVSGTLTVTKATLTVTAADQTRVYGAENPTLTMKFTGFKNGEGVSVVDTRPTISTTVTKTSVVGLYEIVLGGGNDGNYDLNFVNGSLAVTKAPLLVTAENKTRVYGEENPALTMVYTGFANGENVESSGVTSPVISTTAISTSSAGFYPITLTAGNGGANYALILDANGTLVITGAQQTIIFAGLEEQTTDAGPITLTATASSGLPVTFSIVSGPATVSGNVVTLTKEEGTVVVRASQAGDNNYLAAASVDKSFEVEEENTPVTSLEEKTLNLESWPNPVKDELHVTGIPESAKLKIVNGMGTELSSKTEFNNGEFVLDTRDLPVGIYFILIHGYERTRPVRFLKH
jgi:uncharacterized delta-60 repeat protein